MKKTKVPPQTPRLESVSAEKRKFMERAIFLSQEKMAAGFGGPFGAVVVRNGQIVGEGWNKVTSTNDPTAHAEVTAIRNAAHYLGTFDLKGCEIYTSCEPCPMCLASIYWARIDRIYFGNSREDAASIGFDDEFLYQEIGKSLDQRKIPTQQMMKTESFAAFRAWLKKSNKVLY